MAELADGRAYREYSPAVCPRFLGLAEPAAKKHHVITQDFLSASTAFQRASSDCTKLPNSSGDECLATRPMSSKRLRTSALASAAPSSAFSLRTISRGVRVGANTPPQLAKS